MPTWSHHHQQEGVTDNLTADNTLLVGYALAIVGSADPGVTTLTILQRGSGAFALFDYTMSIVMHKRHPHTENLNSEIDWGQ